MNIQTITSLVPKTVMYDSKVNNGQITTNFGLKIDAPIKQDTLSFQGAKVSKVTKKCVNILKHTVENSETAVAENNGITNKVAAKTLEINRTTATAIYNKNLRTMQKVDDFFYNTFGDLVADAKNPNNPILKISCRPKSKNSIIEKTGSREWKSINEILENMTDLKGGKIVLRDSDKKTVDGVLDRLIPAIKSKSIELLEIENKRPKAVKGLPENEASKYDYASINMLEKLIDIQNEAWRKGGSKEKVAAHLTDEFTPANYCAVHFLLRIPGVPNSTFEFQLMGHNTAIAKDIDDVVYKKLDGKNPANCPDAFNALFEPLINPKFFAEETENEAKELIKNAKDKFNQYRREMFLFQRMKADMPYSKKTAKKKEQFLPIQYQLFPNDIELKYGISSLDFDYNNIVKILERGKKKGNSTKVWHYTTISN